MKFIFLVEPVPILPQEMDTGLISDLPDDVKNMIAAVLDVPELPNWRSLIQDVIRPHIDLYNNAGIVKIHMQTLSPGRSPTLVVLNDLGQKGITVGHLINWMSSVVESLPSLKKILDLLSKLQTYVQCTNQGRSQDFSKGGHSVSSCRKHSDAK